MNKLLESHFFADKYAERNVRISALVLNRLRENDPGIQRFHVSLGNDSEKLTDEEIVNQILEVNDEVDRENLTYEKLSEVEKLTQNLNYALNALADIQDIRLSMKEIQPDTSKDHALIKKFNKATSIAEKVMYNIRDTETFKMRNRNNG